MIGKRKHIRQKVRSGNGITNEHQLASCYGKIRHTKEQASARAKLTDAMKAYRCKYCPYYHVGRAPK